MSQDTETGTRQSGGTLLFSVSSIPGRATGPSGDLYDSPIGTWDTTGEVWTGGTFFIPLNLVDESRATYPVNGGRILFHSIDDQGNWNGYWVQRSGEKKPGRNVDDSILAWGAVVLRFNFEYNEFWGKYDYYCDGKKYSWKGHR